MANAESSRTGLDKGLSFAFGVAFLATMLALVVAVPNPTPSQWFVFRVVLALAAGGVGAVIPGLLVVHVSTVVRAGGALALFALIYCLNPPAMLTKPQEPAAIRQTTRGDKSPAIVSGGDVTVQNPPGAPPEKEKRK